MCRPVNAINAVGAYNAVGVNEARAELVGNFLVQIGQGSSKLCAARETLFEATVDDPAMLDEQKLAARLK